MMTSTVTQGFAGIWRLRNDGSWMVVHQRALDRRLEETSELLATLYAEYFGLGSELRADLGQHIVMARADDEGVLVGVHDAGTPALTIRTSMRRIDQASMRGLPSTMSSRQVLAQADAAVTREHEFVPQQDSEPFAVPASSELTFEILFDEVLDDIDGLELPTVAASTDTSWEEICTWIGGTIEAVSSFVGRTVATNYWRQGLDANGLLGTQIELGFRGGCSPAQSGAFDATGAAAMERAYSQWLSRCQRVIPRIDQELGHVAAPPWRRQDTQGNVR